MICLTPLPATRAGSVVQPQQRLALLLMTLPYQTPCLAGGWADASRASLTPPLLEQLATKKLCKVGSVSQKNVECTQGWSPTKS